MVQQQPAASNITDNTKTFKHQHVCCEVIKTMPYMQLRAHLPARRIATTRTKSHKRVCFWSTISPVIKEYINLQPASKKHILRILNYIHYYTIFLNKVPFLKNFPFKNVSDRHVPIQFNPSPALLSNQYSTPAFHSEAIFTSNMHQATRFVTLKQCTYTKYTAHLITQHMPPFSCTTYIWTRIKALLVKHIQVTCDQHWWRLVTYAVQRCIGVPFRMSVWRNTRHRISLSAWPSVTGLTT